MERNREGTQKILWGTSCAANLRNTRIFRNGTLYRKYNVKRPAVKYWQQAVSTNTKESVKQSYKWPKRNTRAKTSAKEALDSIWLTSEQLNLHEYNLKQIIRLANERWDDMERQNRVAKTSGKSSLALLLWCKFLVGQEIIYRVSQEERT